MSQNSIVLPTTGTVSGLTMAQDTNGALDTIATAFSGPSAPGTPFAGQWWHDTTNNIVKLRSMDNAAWISLFSLDESGYTAGIAPVNSPAFVTPSRTTVPSLFTSSTQLADMNAVMASAQGFRNSVINGQMAVAQRGTSGTIVAGTPKMCLDMFQLSCSGANITWNQSTAIGGPNIFSPNCIVLTGNTGVTSTIFKHRIESFSFFPDGHNVTISACIANTTGASITPTLTVKRPSAADNYTTTTTDVSAVSLQACPNSATTQVSYSYAAPNGAYLGTEIAFDFGSVLNSTGKTIGISDVDVRITPGVATGLNSTPPAPEVRPLAYERLLCQRYFETSYADLAAGTTGLNSGDFQGCAINSADFYVFRSNAVFFKVRKRVSPTIALYNPNNGVSNTMHCYTDNTDIAVSAVGTVCPASFGIYCSSSVMTSTRVYATHWTADSGLF